MLSVTQIAAIINDAIVNDDGNTSPASVAAEKIYDLVKPDYASDAMVATLENEVTSTLVDMLAVTILATLIEQEGGGRTNVTFSPGLMQQVLTDWNYTCEVSGMDRTIQITPKHGDAWEDTDRPPSEEKLNSLLFIETSREAKVKPQAEPHEYNRPI